MWTIVVTWTKMVLICTIASHCLCYFRVDVPRSVGLVASSTSLISSQAMLCGNKSFQIYLTNPVPVWKSWHGLLLISHISELKLFLYNSHCHHWSTAFSHNCLVCGPDPSEPTNHHVVCVEGLWQLYRWCSSNVHLAWIGAKQCLKEYLWHIWHRLWG